MAFNTIGGGGAPVPKVEVPHSATLRIPEAVTAEAWVKTSGRVAGASLILGKWAGGSPGWRLGIEPFTGRLRWETVTQFTSPGGQSQTLHAVFVTNEEVNDDHWHHVAGTYDGKRLRVFIDGIPAHRTCSPDEPGSGPNPCTNPPPPEKCVTEVFRADITDIGDAVCTQGTIENQKPILAASDAQGVFQGMLDELRVSNYAKQEFEVAASSRQASAYTQVLGREVELRNQLPVGPEIDNQVADERRAFDARGRFASALKRVRGQHAAEPFLNRAAWDGFDRLGSQEYPTGEVVVGAFDLSGVQTSLIGYGPFVDAPMLGKQAYLTAATTTVTGRLASITFGNRVATTYEYDDGPTQEGGFGGDLLRHQSILAANGTILSQRNHSWDMVGNLSEVNDPAESYRAVYSHDDLNRITSATFQIGGQQPSSFSYDYDSLGNLTLKEGATQQYGRSRSLAGCGTGTTSLPHAITNRTVNQVSDSFCYDEAGRMVKGGEVARSYTRTLYYSARGKLQKLLDKGLTQDKEYTFSYDGDGNRVFKTEPNGATIEPYAYYREVPNGSEVLYSANGRLIARRTLLPGGGPSDVSWYHADHLDGTNLLTDINGAEVSGARSHYKPFGEFIPGFVPQNDQAGGRQFTGKELDDGGLYDYEARYYDPFTGRFIAPDDIGLEGTAQVKNLYSYTLNSPLRFIDPTGHQVEPSMTDQDWEPWPGKVQGAWPGVPWPIPESGNQDGGYSPIARQGAVQLMNDSARTAAFFMQLDSRGKELYEWLDASPYTYQVWGDQMLDLEVGGQFFPGELGSNQCSRAGGTIRLDTQHMQAWGMNPAGILAHELTHAAIFDYQINPRQWQLGARFVPRIVETLRINAKPGGGLLGSHQLPIGPHGALQYYWGYVYDGGMRPR